MPASLVRLSDLLDGEVPQIEEAPSASDFIRELIQRDHKISLFTLSRHVGKSQRIKGKSLEVWIVPLRHNGRTRDLYSTEIRALKRSYSECGQLDILHTHWLHEYTAAASSRDYPHLVTAHDAPLPIALYHRPLAFWAARGLFASVMLTKVRALAVLSPYLASYYRTFHGYKRTLHIVPEFTAPSAYQYAREIDLTERKNLVFAAVLNGYNRRKNSDTLIKAFAIYRETYPEGKLILFGDGHGPGQVAEQWANRHDLCKGIEFAGVTRNDVLLSRLSNEVDVVVHPALEESFGIAVADAMAMGKPVIGGQGCGAVPWVLGGGEAGILVNVRDSRAIAEAMMALTCNSFERRRLGKVASQYASNNFHISKVAERYLEIYLQMVKSFVAK